MKINHNLTETDHDNLDVKSQLEHQTQFQETKDSIWVFDKNISMNVSYFKTGELNGLGYV